MLTDAKARNAKPAEKPYRLLDAEGLHLFVSLAGGKSWRWRHQRDGKERLVTLGRYPAMSLADARRARDALRDEPAGVQAAPTLLDAFTSWHADQAPLWKPHHAADVMVGMKADILPTLGDSRLDQITPKMLLAQLRAVQDRGAVETAHRLRQRVSAVYGHAIAGGAVVNDPAATLTQALKPIVRQGRRAALVDLSAVRDMLRRAEAIPAHPITRLALRLMALTALRPGELRGGEWREVESDVWRIPGARMKHTRARAASIQDHVVPLSVQSLEALDALRGLTGSARLMFPNPANVKTSISENAVGYLLNRAGYAGRQTAHGLRASFSTVMNERYPADRGAIDLMLAHSPKDAVEAAYNRSQHTERRRELAQAWADLLLDGMPEAMTLLDLPRR